MSVTQPMCVGLLDVEAEQRYSLLLRTKSEKEVKKNDGTFQLFSF